MHAVFKKVLLHALHIQNTKRLTLTAETQSSSTHLYASMYSRTKHPPAEIRSEYCTSLSTKISCAFSSFHESAYCKRYHLSTFKLPVHVMGTA